MPDRRPRTWTELDDAFLASIREAPEDDAPRLVYADWLAEQGDPRGEMIRLQCALARRPEGEPEPPELRRRLDELFSDYGNEWIAGYDARADSYQKSNFRFFRGFLDRLVFIGPGASQWLYCLSREPITALEVCDLCCEPHLLPEAEALARQPQLCGVRRLDVRMSSTEPQCALPLLDSPHLSRIESLFVGRSGFFAPVTPREGVFDVLLRCAALPRIRRLGLHMRAVTPGFLGRLLALPGGRLEHLDLSGEKEWTSGFGYGDPAASTWHAAIGSDCLVALAEMPGVARLRELDVCCEAFDERALRALLGSPYLEGLETLRILELTDTGGWDQPAPTAHRYEDALRSRFQDRASVRSEPRYYSQI